MRRSNRWIGEAKRQALYERDGHRCHYCDIALEQLQETARPYLTLDHLVPGTNNDPSNLITCCHLCNSRKGLLDYRVFAPERAREIKAAAGRGYKRLWAKHKVLLAVERALPAAVDSHLREMLDRGYSHDIDGEPYVLVPLVLDDSDIPF